MKEKGKKVVRKSKKRSQAVQYGIIYVFLILGAFIFLIPLAWMIVTSLKIPAQIYTFPPQWIPKPVAWENYPKSLNFFPFFKYLLNTIYLCILVITGTVISCSLVANSMAGTRDHIYSCYKYDHSTLSGNPDPFIYIVQKSGMDWNL